jgi:hypothetical protein
MNKGVKKTLDQNKSNTFNLLKPIDFFTYHPV